MMVWACTINRLITDDGLDAFNATFRSGWNAGIRKPLPGPLDVDTSGIDIAAITENLRLRMEGKERVS
jgi:hypothetical protein